MTEHKRTRDDRNQMDQEEQDEKRRNMQGSENQESKDKPHPRRRGEVDFTPVDSYTGEPIPPEPAGDIPLDDMEVDSFADVTDLSHLEEDKAMDFALIERGSDDEPLVDLIDDYTDDTDIIEDFAERQNLSSGTNGLYENLVEHHSKGPMLSGGDIDADWAGSDVSGEESVGGSAPTPDQDVVDELGEAVGISYEDDEELNTEEKLGERDRNRWELDPRSQDEEQNDLEGRDEEERGRQQELDDF
jgi:hypothetical protein